MSKRPTAPHGLHATPSPALRAPLGQPGAGRSPRLGRSGGAGGQGKVAGRGVPPVHGATFPPPQHPGQGGAAAGSGADQAPRPVRGVELGCGKGFTQAGRRCAHTVRRAMTDTLVPRGCRAARQAERGCFRKVRAGRSAGIPGPASPAQVTGRWHGPARRSQRAGPAADPGGSSQPPPPAPPCQCLRPRLSLSRTHRVTS